MAGAPWIFINDVSPHIFPLSTRWEESAGVVATAFLFMAGGLFGDLSKRPRAPSVGPPQPPGRTPPVGTPFRQGESEERALLLVQALGPSLLALLGIALNAAVTLSAQP